VLSTHCRSPCFEGHPGILARQEIADRLAVLASSRSIPRDDAQNQAVMARAERLSKSAWGTNAGRWLSHRPVPHDLESQNPNEIADARGNSPAGSTIDPALFLRILRNVTLAVIGHRADRRGRTHPQVVRTRLKQTRPEDDPAGFSAARGIRSALCHCAADRGPANAGCVPTIRPEPPDKAEAPPNLL